LSARDLSSRSSFTVQATLIGAMAVWGLNVIIVKSLTASYEPMALAVVRMVVACFALTAIVLWRRCGISAVTVRQGTAIVACAALMVYTNQILCAEGLVRSTATNGSLIMALSPPVSSVLAALAFEERLTAQRLAGVTLGVGGVAAVGT